MYVGAAVSAVGVLLTLLGSDAIRDAIEESNGVSGPAMTQAQIDAAVGLTIAFTAVIGLAAVGLWLWMASANKKGRSWARVVATVLGGLNILLSLGSLVLSGSTTVATLLNLVSLVLAAAILWLLYRPESSRYYAAVSGQRR
jgi:CDP-diglyceride synthetase